MSSESRPRSSTANKLMEYARADGVLAIRGLQALLINAAIELDRATSPSETERNEIVKVVARTVDLGGQGMTILDAPCVFCEYNGAGYWQRGTHDKKCPFHDVGGDATRADYIVMLAGGEREGVEK